MRPSAAAYGAEGASQRRTVRSLDGNAEGQCPHSKGTARVLDGVLQGDSEWGTHRVLQGYLIEGTAGVLEGYCSFPRGGRWREER